MRRRLVIFRIMMTIYLLSVFCCVKSQECIHIDWAGYTTCGQMRDKISFYEGLKNINKNYEEIDIYDKDTISMLKDFLTKREKAGIRVIAPEMIVYIENEDKSVTEYEVCHVFFREVGDKMVYRLPVEMIEILVDYFPCSLYLQKLFYFHNDKQIRRLYFKGEKGYWYVKM